MFSSAVLDIDPAQTADRIAEAIRGQVMGTLRRRGAVVGLSGGIDSSVSAALAARALGQDKVLGLLMPEQASAEESLLLGRLVADALGIATLVEDIAPALEATGCYRRQTEAIRQVLPDYAEGDKFKLVLPSILAGERLNVTRLVVLKAHGESVTVLLTA